MSDAAGTTDDGAELPGPLKLSPLDARHRALGATMGAFGGWDMPISYAGAGVVAEHTAVRTAVGVFDVSHLGKASVTGPGAAAFLNDCLANDLGRIRPGQAQYTLCCTGDGGVLDDLIAYLVSPDEVFLIPNAANTAAVVAALAARRPDLHIVVTGRNAKPELIEAADLVTEMTLVKHHFAAGVKAQQGIEF